MFVGSSTWASERGSMPDEEDEIEKTFVEIDAEMAWGCRVEDGQVRVYLSADHSITLDRDSARALLRALIQALEEKEE